MAVRLTTLFHSTSSWKYRWKRISFSSPRPNAGNADSFQKRLQLGHGPFCSARVITGNHYWKPGALYHWGLVEPIPKPFRLLYPTNPGFSLGVGNDGNANRTRSYGSTPSMTGCRDRLREAPLRKHRLTAGFVASASGYSQHVLVMPTSVGIPLPSRS